MYLDGAKGGQAALGRALSPWRQPVLGFGLALIAVVWIAVTALLFMEARTQRTERARDADNFTLILEQNLYETFKAIDNSLLFMRWVEAHDNYKPDWSAVLGADRRIDNEYVQASVVDAKGMMIASTVDPRGGKRLDLSDREHFRAQLNATDDRLFIGPVVIGRASGVASVQFSRKRVDAEGHFTGVLVLSLPANHFDRHFAKLDLGPGGGLAMVGDDGVVRAGSGRFKDAVGKMWSDSGADNASGGFLSMRRVGAYPIRVIAQLPDIETDNAWKFRREFYLIAATIFSLLTLTVTVEVATRRQAYEDEILHLSRYDSLTRLPNRLTLSQRLASLCAPAEEQRDFALLIVDLDRFKIVNDTYGHATGDELLRAVAARLSEVVGPNAMVARLGGDEFAVVQPDVLSDDEPAHLAHAICEALAAPFAVTRATLVLGATVGIARGPRDGAVAAELLKSADLALYGAKANERGAYSFYSPAMTQAVHARLRIETGLRTALANHEFQIVYQPIKSTRTGETQAFEALLRWRRQQGEIVPPSEFIPVAEDLGLIVDIGAWVLHRSCADIAALPGNVGLSVNSSPVQFETTNFAQTVRDALAFSGLAPERLHIEITESMLMKDHERIVDQLREIRAMGVGVSIDDFGTGYSCLSYLELYPIDTLKIDRQFVDNVGKREEAEATLRAIVDLAASFGMKTIAEGVETQEQFRALSQLGCAAVQGFLLGRPHPLSHYFPADVAGSADEAAKTADVAPASSRPGENLGVAAA